MNSSEKTVKKIAAVVLGIMIAAASFVGGYFTHYLSIDKQTRTYMWVMQMIKDHYYQETSPDELLDISLDALIAKLDPYYKYYTKEEYARILSERQGERSGFGITMTNEQGNCTVFAVSGNSPAEKAGVKRGDVLIGMGESADSIALFADYDSAVKNIQAIAAGKDTVFATLDEKTYTMAKAVYEENYVYYGDDTGYFGYTSQSNIMTLTPLDAPQELSLADSDTAYIKLTSFNGNASAQFAGALLKFKANNKIKLVLDLRFNGGGYMDILINIAEHLIYSDTQKLYAAVAKYKDSEVYYPLKNSFYNDYGFKNIAVLANGGTASASECLIGAMLDYGSLTSDFLFISEYEGNENALTFGKGIMQTTYTHSTGAALKLTTAQVFWPVSDISIHGIGISGVAVATDGYNYFAPHKDNELQHALNALAS